MAEISTDLFTASSQAIVTKRPNDLLRGATFALALRVRKPNGNRHHPGHFPVEPDRPEGDPATEKAFVRPRAAWALQLDLSI